MRDRLPPVRSRRRSRREQQNPETTRNRRTADGEPSRAALGSAVSDLPPDFSLSRRATCSALYRPSVPGARDLERAAKRASAKRLLPFDLEREPLIDASRETTTRPPDRPPQRRSHREPHHEGNDSREIDPRARPSATTPPAAAAPRIRCSGAATRPR
jgi:hypothetical protein